METKKRHLKSNRFIYLAFTRIFFYPRNSLKYVYFLGWWIESLLLQLFPRRVSPLDHSSFRKACIQLFYLYCHCTIIVVLFLQSSDGLFFWFKKYALVLWRKHWQQKYCQEQSQFDKVYQLFYLEISGWAFISLTLIRLELLIMKC